MRRHQEWAQWHPWNDGGRHGHWGTSYLALASFNPTKLDFIDRRHIVDRPDGKCMTDYIATPIWDQMTASQHHGEPYSTRILLVGNKNHGVQFGV
jgi:hypothetical protein